MFISGSSLSPLESLAAILSTNVDFPSPGSPCTIVIFPYAMNGYQSHFISSACTSDIFISFSSVFSSILCLTFVNNHCFNSELLLYFIWYQSNRSPLLLSAGAFLIAVRKASISAINILHHLTYQ